MNQAVRRRAPSFSFARLLAASLCPAVVACLSAPSADSGAVPPKGCGIASPPPTAPNGYYTSGGTVCTATAAAHVFHGVDRPSLEWSPVGQNLGAGDYALMAGWGANVVRIALNQDFWLSGAALYDPGYASVVAQQVQWAEAVGLDVILDLHWSDQGDLTVADTSRQGAGYSNQQPMADVNSREFWKEVATTFKGDGHVLFELYNEPHNISTDVWLNGGSTNGFTAVGMQDLYNAIRGAGANNVVIAGGTNWAYDLSGVGPGGVSIQGYNVMYATHPYLLSGDAPNGWESAFGHLETQDFAPVVATEFGDGTTPGCSGTYDSDVIDFAAQHHMSFTAWAWFVDNDPVTDPQGCHFPSLILDWGATPTVQGAAVKDALAAFPPPVAPPAPALATTDAGDEGSSVDVDASDAGADEGDAPAE
ncbi:MAG TPA: cellulase family glycosylhydrolase [Polyangiaceae bacterium]